jgi:hypothetical protein
MVSIVAIEAILRISLPMNLSLPRRVDIGTE